MPEETSNRVTAGTIFLAFLKLGCHAFGGPTAHFGYFHEEFVKRRRWIDEAEYADTVALCQFLPGPSSSQTGFAIGLKQGGLAGAFLAWVGFTLPSAVLMIAFALGLSYTGDLAEAGWVTGLKLTAVAVVANAGWNMATKLCPDRARATVAVAVLTFLLLVSNPLMQLVSILAGCLVGMAFFQNRVEPASSTHETSTAGSKGLGAVLLAVFALLLVGLPITASLATEAQTFAFMDAFYRAGSLVFGGGHVVLPLLESYTVQNGWISESSFLAGYGAAQALPGPLFAFSAFLGTAVNTGPTGITGGVLALVMIYVPSWLLVLGAMPFWNHLRKVHLARAALLGANAAVVGLLFAALYHPIWTSAVTGAIPLALALAAFTAIRFWKVPPWLVVLASAGLGHLIF